MKLARIALRVVVTVGLVVIIAIASVALSHGSWDRVPIVRNFQHQQPGAGIPVTRESIGTDPLSAFANPVAAFHAATQELNLSSSLWDENDVSALPYLFLLAESDEGYLNADTSNYYIWLKEILSGWLSPMRKTAADRVAAQIHAVIYQPNSEIAKRFERIESGEDPLLRVSGPQSYWDYLFLPYDVAIGNTSVVTLGLDQTKFQTSVNQYYAEIFQSTVDESFRSFLSSQNYLPYWMQQK